MKGYIVDTSYITTDKTEVLIFLRLENGQSAMTRHTYKPYCFIQASKLAKVRKYLSKYEVTEVSATTFHKEPVVQITAPTFPELTKLVEVLHKLEVDTYEADIKPDQRLLYDHDLKAVVTLEGEYEPGELTDRVYHEPTLAPTTGTIPLKILSLDTESDEAGNLFCIGLQGEKLNECYVITKKKLANARACKDEANCLEQAFARIKEYDPDVITGWNMIGHDFALLQERAKQHEIPFKIGRTDASVRLRITDNFFRPSTASVEGRMILDALTLMRDPFIKEAPSIKFATFDSYTLEDVAQALIGKGKLLRGKERHAQIIDYYNTDQQKLVDYNLRDCQLVTEILQKTSIIQLAQERATLTGMPLDRITASIAAFDSLYIRTARRHQIVCPTTRYSKKESKILGGYVKQPEPGLYHNVIVVDFKSLYPSIIRTFNIDPASYREKKEKNVITSPNGAHFLNQQGILPEILAILHEAREQAKKEKRELATYAIKIIMNSFFGVLASPTSRFFVYDMGNAITHFAQKIIKEAAERAERAGCTVIYSDTDSLFLTTNKKSIVPEKLIADINDYFTKTIQETYQRASLLELEYEKKYSSLLFPQTRQKKDEEIKAAKKRYAGLYTDKGKEQLEIVGLEAIRGDWTEAAQEFQKELLMRLFHEEKIEAFIRDYCKKIRAGKLDSQLLYRKSLRKGLDEYTKTTPPHVKAARLLDKLESDQIEYYITTVGPEPLQKHTHPLDYDHYISKQIEPIATQILAVLGKSFADLTSSSKQSTL